MRPIISLHIRGHCIHQLWYVPQDPVSGQNTVSFPCWHPDTRWHTLFLFWFLQNNHHKPKSNLTAVTSAIEVTNVQGQFPASFPTVLFITFSLSLTYFPLLLLPSPLLLAWNRHPRKCTLDKLSSRCSSWFHKWCSNGQGSWRGGQTEMAATAVCLHAPSGTTGGRSEDREGWSVEGLDINLRQGMWG